MNNAFPRSVAILKELGLPVRDTTGDMSSPLRFADGSKYHLEIPSVEGPEAFAAVIDEAAVQDVKIHRVSQGSGVWMLTDNELRDYAVIGHEHGIETVLFVGPRASWDIGVQYTARSGAIVAGAARGANGIAYGVEEALRAAEFGINGVLVADIGLLQVLGSIRNNGHLPKGFVLKVSASFPVTNPATAGLLESLGATSLNLATDLPTDAISSIRQNTTLPLDVYIESADEFGGSIRYYDSCEIVRVAAPTYLKFTVRNSPPLYPSGRHLRTAVLDLCRERVHRAKCGLELLRRHMQDLDT